MNACLFFVILIVIFYKQVSKERLVSSVRSSVFRDITQALQKRDYLLKGESFRVMKRERDRERKRKGMMGEQDVFEWVREAVRAGTLRLESLDELERIHTDLRVSSEESRSLLKSYVSHLLFICLVPTLFRMVLRGTLWFGYEDVLELSLVFGLLTIALWGLYDRWPCYFSAEFEDLVRAHLGRGDTDQLSDELRRIRDVSLAEGWDEWPRQLSFLKEWQLKRRQLLRDRQVWLENALGPSELVGSAAISFLLLSLPLLSHFASLS